MKNLLQHASMHQVVKASITTNQKQGFYHYCIYHGSEMAISKCFSFCKKGILLALIFFCSISITFAAQLTMRCDAGQIVTIYWTSNDPADPTPQHSANAVDNDFNGIVSFNLPNDNHIFYVASVTFLNGKKQCYIHKTGNSNLNLFLPFGNPTFIPSSATAKLVCVVDMAAYASQSPVFNNNQVLSVVNGQIGIMSCLKFKNAASVANNSFNMFADSNFANTLPNYTGNITVSLFQSFTQSLSLMVSSTNVSCGSVNDGSAQASVTGGAPPYIYSWGPGNITTTGPNISNLQAGTYTVMVTDMNGATAAAETIVNQSTSLNITAQVSQPSCENDGLGSITIAVTGSNMPLSYTWNNGSVTKDQTGLLPGTYTVSVAGVPGCLSTATFSLAYIADTAAPVFESMNDMVVNTDAGKNYATVNFIVTASDNCYTASNLCKDNLLDCKDNGCMIRGGLCAIDSTSILFDCRCKKNLRYLLNVETVPASGSPFFKGVTRVFCTATDASGNTSTYTFNVTVNDNEAPKAKYSDVTLALSANGTATLTPAMLNDSSTDNCGIISKVITPAVLSCGNIGTNSVTVKVTDGNNYYWIIDSISVKYFNNNGILINTYSTLGYASVVVTGDGGFILYNPITGVMTKYNKDGVLQSTIIVSNTGKASTITLTGNGGFIVYDPNTGVMKLYNSGGVLISTMIVSNTGAASTITTLPGCGFIVYDLNTGVMYLYNNAGVLLTTIIVSNTGVASTITVLPDCSFIVYDPNTGVMKLYNSAGDLLTTIIVSNTGAASTITILPGCGFIVYDPNTGIMKLYNNAGDLLTTIIVSNTGAASTITIFPDCSFIVYDPNTGIMKLYNSAGDLLTTMIVSNTGAASTITILPDGGFIVYDPNTGIMKKYNKDGVLQSTTIVSNTGAASTITILPGCGYIVYDLNTGVMYLYNNAGVLLTTIVVSNTGAESTITVLPDCSFIVYDPNTGIMKLYNSAGVLLTTIVVSNTGAASTITILTDCGFIVYDPNTGVMRLYNNAGVLLTTIIVSNTGVASTITILADCGFIVHDPNTGIASKYNKDGVLQSTIITTGDVKITPDATGGFKVKDNGVRVRVYDKNGILLSTVFTSGDSYIYTNSELSATNTVQVTVLNPIAVTGVVKNVDCSGLKTGKITLTVTGITGPFTYMWSNGKTAKNLTNIAGGTYTCNVSDTHGCNNAVTFVVSQPTPINVAVSKTTIKCGGASTGTATASASGGTLPYTFSWNTIPLKTGSSVSGLSAGTYIVTVTDANGCTKTKSVAITQNQPIAVAIQQSFDHATAVPTGGVGPYTYKWNTVPVQTNSTATGLICGHTYKVTVKDSKGCQVQVTFTLACPRQGEAIVDGNDEVGVFPNPTSGFVNIEMSDIEDGKYQLQLFDVTGREVFTKEVELINGATTLDFGQQANGIYSLKIAAGNKMFTSKVVIQN
ncbi:MAG: T9SS type A sorting domain-containing protein [Bacteroidia bacterium]